MSSLHWEPLNWPIIESGQSVVFFFFENGMERFSLRAHMVPRVLNFIVD